MDLAKLTGAPTSTTLSGNMELPKPAFSSAPILPGEGEERVWRLLESITDGFFALDADWRFIFLNEAAKRILSPHWESPGELVGLSHWEAFPETRGTLLEREFHRAVEEGTAVEFESFYSPWKRWYSVRGYPIRGGGLSVYFLDITEEKEASATLRASHEKYRMLFDSIDEGFCLVEMLWDEHGRATDYRFLEANPAFEEQTGLRNALGKTALELLPGLEAHWIEVYGRVASTGEPTRFTQGSVVMGRWFDVYAFAFGAGRDRSVAILFRNITEQRRSEEALRMAKKEAETALRAKDDFLAALSHELRTPLTPVLMAAADLCDDPELPPSMHETLCMMQRNISLEARLIDDLLDLTRVARGKLALRLQDCDAHVLLGLALEIVRDDAQAKGIMLDVDLTARRGHFRGDAARLQQVFWNLLKNAVKFTPPAGRICIRSWDEEGQLSVEISDNGIGIAPESLERIFLPFEQAGFVNNHRFGGLGLGLAIAKAIVEMHGGTIAATSEGLGQGATFLVELPANEQGSNVAPESAGDAPAEPDHADTHPGRSLRLLLVEDHEPTLAILSRLLTRAGYEVLTADSVAAAQKLAAREHFDAVVSDIGLPDGSGIDLMESLHTERGLRGVAVSGYGMEEDLRRSREVGFVAHLVKPVDFAQLRRALTAFAVPGAGSV